MKNLIIKLAVLFFGFPLLFGCNQKNVSPAVSSKPAITVAKSLPVYGLATTIHMEPEKTVVQLEDYFTNPHEITSLAVPGKLSYHFSGDKKQLTLFSNPELEPVFFLDFSTGGQIVSIPVMKPVKRKVVFRFDPKGKSYKTVQLVGEINAWNPANTPLKFHKGNWEATLFLKPGTYAYQIVLDGKWQLDPNNTKEMDNGMGGKNSVMVVKGADKTKRPKLYTKKDEGRNIVIGVEHKVDKIIGLWQNQEVTIRKENNDYKVTVPEKAASMKRTYLRIWAHNEAGVSRSLRIPLEYGSPVSAAEQLTRADKETNIMYFLMVDRFKNGNKTNDRPLNDPEVLPKADFFGGDIAGVTKMLESGYFEDLGITAIWLSPIVKNPEGAYGLFNKGGVKTKFSAYHGYWPVSFTQIDDRFGTDEDLDDLVNTAHNRGINIFLDFISNHVHEKHPVYQANKDNGWATDLYLPDGTLNTERWDEYRLTTWFDIFLPTLNLEKPEISEMLSDSALFWLERYNIDGFRHDATKHIPQIYWRLLTKKIKAFSEKNHNRSVFQIGETYGTPELINSYIGSGMLDGQFDFNVHDAWLQTICQDEKGFEEVQRRMEQSFDYYGVNNLMGYMTGNQDRPRFMAMATGDVRFDEDSKLAGWTRTIDKKTKKGYQKLGLMNAAIMTISGIPVIYYGDEVGMTGGNDPDNRRMMKFENLTEDALALRKKVSQLAKIRRNNLAFLLGDFTFLKTEKNVISYARKYFDHLGIVFINNSDKPKTITVSLPDYYDLSNLKHNFSSKFEINGQELKITIPSFGFEVLTK